MKIIVDADACPRGAMAVLRRLSTAYGCGLITVASFHHAIPGADHVVVGDAPDEADLAVANRASPGDVVVTQDLGLAALAVAKGARAISPMGERLDSSSLDFRLEERYLKAQVRRRGGRTKGPKARTAADDARFESALRDLLESAPRP